MTSTLMECEALETPHVLTEQFAQNHLILMRLRDHVRQANPMLAMTVARGSSDHAATFAKYLLETKINLPTASAAPSVFTLYGKQLPLKNCLVIAISQSGASPDIAEMLISARKTGAITVAIVNQVASPLALAAEYVIPLWAGEEKAVAATKTYIATLAALIHLTAILTDDKKLMTLLQQLPNQLEQASHCDWSCAIAAFQHRQNTLVIGRGYGYPVAQEAALKFKETSRLHAEALSGAELMHGPFALIEKNFPILVFAQHDETLQSLLEISQRMKSLGANVLFASPDNKKENFANFANVLLPLPPSIHPVCDPLLIIQAFYLMAARLSVARGENPDAPDNLSKVTLTW